MNIYDVIITLPNIKAEDEDEAVYEARQKARQIERPYIEVKFIEKEEE